MASRKSDGAPREIELKLAFRPADRDRLERLLSGTPSPPQHLVTTYFDTGDRRLAEHGVTLRVRRVGDVRTQTVKALEAGPGAAAERGEWEWPVTDDRPDGARLAETAFADLLAPAARLTPLFRTEVDRSIRVLMPDAGTEVEAAIDEGRILAGEREEPLHELELELKQGHRKELYRLAARLHEAVPLTIATESKFSRGYALRLGHPGGAAKPRAPALARATRTGDAFRRIVRGALGSLLANLAPTLRGDTEGLHQMRVSLRRLRADLVLFKPFLDPDRAAAMNDRLRRLGRILGDARDWDVLVLETLPTILAKAPGETWPYALQQAGATHRRAAHAAVEQSLDAPAFTALVLQLSASLEDTDAGFLREQAPTTRPVSRVAPALLERLAGKVRKRGKHPGRLSGPKLHALRKSMKKLHYGVAALEKLFERREVERFLKGCKSLQKILGRINDAIAAERLVVQASQGRKDLVVSVEALTAWSRRRRKKDRRKLDRAWSRFEDARAFWH
jgi:inorganic triphosphatase YgiF